jgi:hypothetical protein
LADELRKIIVEVFTGEKQVSQKHKSENPHQT